MRNLVLPSLTIAFALSTLSVSAQQSDSESADIIQAGSVVSSGQLIAHCYSAPKDEPGDNRVAFVVNDQRLLNANIAMYAYGQEVQWRDDAFGMDAGEYVVELSDDEGVIYRQEIELTAGIEDYSIHFHDIMLQSKSLLEEEIQFSIFPNPSDDVVYIDDLSEEELEIILVDSQGREVLRETKQFAMTTHTMSTEQLENGKYVVRIEDEDGRVGSYTLVVAH